MKGRLSRCRKALIATLILCNQVNAFQMSMVASRVPLGKSFDNALGSKSQVYASTVQTSSTGVTSSLISTLAVSALKRRLRNQSHVSCDITASSSNVLLRGLVGPVTVKGRGWQSRMGLTCRAIEATVDSCELDIGRILSSQKLVLTTPGRLVGCFSLVCTLCYQTG